MKIKEMTATFGKLDKASLKLSPGLNILEAPNEGGKSTWSAFLRAMLYGIPTNQRDKTGFLAEKNRYQPWSGAPMEGTMTVEWQGREVLLRRKAKGSAPFAAFEAVDAATGAPIPELTAATAGELLIGAEREVFERSAFVGQSALAVDGAPGLEKRIAGLLTAGQEEVSFSQVERQLKDWRNRRQHNKTGLIPKLEQEIAEGEALLARFRSARQQREEGMADLETLREQKAELETEKAAHKALAEQAKWEQYEKAYEEYRAARKEYEDTAALFQNLPEPDKLSSAQEDLQYIQALAASLRIKDGELQRAREEAPEPGGAAGLTAGNLLACGLAAVAAALVAFFVGYRFSDFPGSGSTAAMVQNLVYHPLSFGGLGFLALLVGVGAGALTALFLKRSKGKKQERQAYLAWEERVAALEREADALRTERSERLNALLVFVHTFAPTVTNEFGISAALSRAAQGESRMAPAKARLEGAVRVVELAKAALGNNPQRPVQVPVQPQRSYQETVARLAVVSEELSRKERMVAAAEGELRSLGDPDRAEAELEAKKEELERRREEYGALTLALDVLGEANNAMQARFSPALNRRAGELMAALTGGKYDSLSLTRTFEALARETGQVLPRSVLSLSQGTADQLYLAVRLAVCDLTLPAGDPPPLILDDALANFDDERMVLALEHLRSRSERQQILLFTCHSREGAWAEGKPGVSRLRLNDRK